MKKIALFFLLFLITLFAFVACNENSATSHDSTQPLCSENSTCSDDSTQTTESSTCLIHNWAQATCLEPKTCLVCHKTQGKPLGHFEIIDVAIEPTCTKTGLTGGSHCYRCNEVLVAQQKIAALPHTIVSHPKKEATCTDIGWRAYEECLTCDWTTYSEIPAVGHAEGEWIIDREASCSLVGAKHKTCNICNQKTIDEIIPSVGHAEGEWIIDREASCSLVGAKHKTCNICNQKTIDEIIPCIPHEYQKKIQSKSCVNEAACLYTCSGCEATYITPFSSISASITEKGNISYNPGVGTFDYVTYKIIPTGGYGTYQYKYEVFKNASYTTPSITTSFTQENTYKIADFDVSYLNGAILKVTILDEAGQKTAYEIDVYDLYGEREANVLKTYIIVEHNYGDWIIDKKVTCTENGTRHRVCYSCNEINTEEIISEGHHYWTFIDKEATCTEEGNLHKGCLNCEEIFYTETIPQKDHAYNKSYNSSDDTIIYVCENCTHSYSTNADISLKITETYTKYDQVDFKIQTQINVDATGGYGTLYYKYEVFSSKTSTTPIDKLTDDFSNTKDWYGFKSAITVNGYVIQVTVKDDYGHSVVQRVLITNDGIELLE